MHYTKRVCILMAIIQKKWKAWRFHDSDERNDKYKCDIPDENKGKGVEYKRIGWPRIESGTLFPLWKVERIEYKCKVWVSPLSSHIQWILWWRALAEVKQR